MTSSQIHRVRPWQRPTTSRTQKPRPLSERDGRSVIPETVVFINVAKKKPGAINAEGVLQNIGSLQELVSPFREKKTEAPFAEKNRIQKSQQKKLRKAFLYVSFFSFCNYLFIIFIVLLHYFSSSHFCVLMFLLHIFSSRFFSYIINTEV